VAAPAPLSDWPAAERARIEIVFTDIDDTLTLHGRLPAVAYAALERLTEAGVRVIPVTGRPAGWCDQIARLWPVAGVIGENGALAFRYDTGARKLVRRFLLDEATRRADRERLDRLRERILADVPGTALASDQPYREADLAIDFCEDVPPLPETQVRRIVALFEAAGATAKVSSIHVNGWFGQYDKLTMTRLFVREALGLDLDAALDRCAFVGDSPNDAPMFGFFPHSIGVANVAAFLGRIATPPRYVTQAEGGHGFADAAAMILRARDSSDEGLPTMPREGRSP
jgi:HAD superfamily hydrolase (TIGR01484 family)